MPDIELLIQLQKNALAMFYILMMVILYANLATTNGFLMRNLFFIVLNVLLVQPIVLAAMILILNGHWVLMHVLAL